MKNFTILFLISIYFFLSNACNSQPDFNPFTDCPDISVEATALPEFGGLLKPERTDLSGLSQAPSESRLNVLLVFVVNFF